MKQIQLTQGRVALIDDEDFEYLNQWKWSAAKRNNTYYAYGNQKVNGKYVTTQMHRFLLGITDKKTVCDHIDRNGLNNQKYNLRVCKQSNNMANRTSSKTSSSKYLGVDWHGKLKKWRVQIMKDSKKTHIGLYESELQAAKAYDKHALEIHGEFANLNFNGL